MNYIERIKKDREIIQRIDNRKDKYIYIWDYYKIPLLILSLSLALIISMTIKTIVKKPNLMNVVVLNNDSSLVEVDPDAFIKEFEKAGIDTAGKEINIVDYLSIGVTSEDEDLETLQVLNAMFTMSDLDLYVAPEEWFEPFIEKDGFVDLTTVLDNELLENNSERLYKTNNSEGQEIVAGIILDDSILHKAGYYHNEIYAGLVCNGDNIENAIAFVKQLLND